MPVAASFEEAASGAPGTAVYFQLEPARTLRFKHRFSRNLETPVEKQLAFDFSETRLWHLTGQWKVWSEFGLVLSPDGSVVKTSFSFPDESEVVRYIRKAAGQGLPGKHQHISGNMYVFTNIGSGNYFHAITELIPALLQVPALPQLTLFTAGALPTFVQELIQLLRPEATVLSARPDIAYSADQLYCVEWGLNFIPERYRVLKNLLVKEIRKPTEKIYIHRSSGNRRILNETDVVQAFTDAGFKSVQTENLTVIQQAELFSRASTIAGSHGAGFANTIWMDTPVVLEIRPEGWENRSLYHHALACGCSDYTVMDAPFTGDAMHMTVNVEMLRDILLRFQQFN